MQSSNITGSTFKVIPLNEGAYQLSVQFSNGQENVSNKTFTFYQLPSVQKGMILDVITKNGISQSQILETFTNRDVKEAKSVTSMLNSTHLSFPKVAVLDLKDSHSHYTPCAECEHSIAVNEQYVCDFFKSSLTPPVQNNPAQKLHHLFHTILPIDFVICEGSLKQALVKKGGFSDKEVEFLYTKVGAVAFCQLAEFFMNGFKTGQTARATASEYLAEHFITPLSSRFPSFKPYQESVVYYPGTYKQIYSPEGDFAQILKPVFSITGDYNQINKITTLSFSRKI